MTNYDANYFREMVQEWMTSDKGREYDLTLTGEPYIECGCWRQDATDGFYDYFLHLRHEGDISLTLIGFANKGGTPVLHTMSAEMMAASPSTADTRE